MLLLCLKSSNVLPPQDKTQSVYYDLTVLNDVATALPPLPALCLVLSPPATVTFFAVSPVLEPLPLFAGAWNVFLPALYHKSSAQ